MKKVERRKDNGNILVRYTKSFKHAVDGMIYAIENEQNVLVMMIAAIVTFLLSFFFNISKIELCIVVLCIGIVITCEMINCAIESVVDLVTLKEHPLAKIAKDCSSSASLVASVISLLIGCIIFIPKILELF